jgi:gliding motility-associated transport system permease protein
VKAIWITLKKELMSYCFSPVSYLIAVLFYEFHGLLVWKLTQQFSAAEQDQDLFAGQTFGLGSTFLMVVFVPGILTMRCFAEERRSGTMETLMTAPVREHEIVLGKWLAATLFYAALWLPTIVVLWVLTWQPFLAVQLSFGPVLTAYLGLFLWSALLLAFGCFASSLTDNVLLAAILSMLFNFGLFQLPGLLYDWLQPWLDDYYVNELYQKINIPGNFSSWFARGLVDTSQVVFFVGGIAFFLFLNVLSLQTRRVQ